MRTTPVIYPIKKNFLYPVLLFLTAVAANAQDHLEPIARTTTDIDMANYTTIRNKIVGDMPDNSGVRFVVLPPSGLRNFFDIGWDDAHSNYYIVVKQVKNSYKNGNEIVEEFSKRQREISEESALLIKELFTKAVNTQKDYKGQRNTKETGYYFAIRTNILLCAATWSPFAEDIMKDLVEICTQLLAMAQNETVTPISFDDAFTGRINAIIEQLN